ncbi:pleckstrin homology-like domain family B member 3 isoform X1 [Heptranchias perlo]|uniref:pleckstrin homology-like domain family B member 3 isoform X1 n=1 Tax=Heptranchias perlo TaxID=212740 RepID=UPI00355996F6
MTPAEEPKPTGTENLSMVYLQNKCCLQIWAPIVWWAGLTGTSPAGFVLQIKRRFTRCSRKFLLFLKAGSTENIRLGHHRRGLARPGARRLDAERLRIVARITAASQRLTDLERQKEELKREVEMELALVHGELRAERDLLERERQAMEQLRTKIAGLSQALQAEKDKEKAKLETEREKLEEARNRVRASRSWFDRQPESAKEQQRERLQEEAEALEVALKMFEDLEFQSLEKESSLEEERETEGRFLKLEMVQCRQRAHSRKDRVAKLEEQIGQIKEQARNGSERLTEAWNQAVQVLSTEEENMFSLETLYSTGTGSRSLPDGAERTVEVTGFLKRRRRRTIPAEGNGELTSSAPCVLSATHFSAIDSSLPDPLLRENGPGIVPRRRQEDRGGKEMERPVSLHEKVHAISPMQLLSLLALQRSHSFGTQRPRALCDSPRTRPAPGDQPCPQRPPTDLPGTSGLRSNGCSLHTLAEMEKKLRAAMAEKERLLKAREAQRRAREEAQRGEKVLNGESVVSDPQTPACSVRHEKNLCVRRAPIVKPTFDLRSHVEASGHGVEGCRHLAMAGKVCRGYLTKMGGRIKTWRKRWFVFDGAKRRLAYFADKQEMKLKGVIYFQAIEEVYIDHLRSAPKSPNPLLTFCLKTYDRLFYLVAPTDVALRIWMEVILTAVEGTSQF